MTRVNTLLLTTTFGLLVAFTSVAYAIGQAVVALHGGVA